MAEMVVNVTALDTILHDLPPEQFRDWLSNAKFKLGIADVMGLSLRQRVVKCASMISYRLIGSRVTHVLMAPEKWQMLMSEFSSYNYPIFGRPDCQAYLAPVGSFALIVSCINCPDESMLVGSSEDGSSLNADRLVACAV